jgi:hypothetical protein
VGTRGKYGGLSSRYHPEYDAWRNMIRKCSGALRRFEDGRGVTVCERWLEPQHGFANFFSDMGEKPRGSHFIRIDENGNYDPDNCRWVRKLAQHGREENSYQNMKQRCTNPDSPDYRWYGGRGITVCQRWRGKNGLKNFIADMGERPEGTYLTLVDLNGKYEKSNCRWSREKKQTRDGKRNPTLTARLTVGVEQKIRDALDAELEASGTSLSASVRRALFAYFHLEPIEEE